MCDKQELIIDNLRERLIDVQKHYKDFEVVHQRLVRDIERHRADPNYPVAPMKIQRAVGLQVYTPSTPITASTSAPIPIVINESPAKRKRQSTEDDEEPKSNEEEPVKKKNKKSETKTTIKSIPEMPHSFEPSNVPANAKQIPPKPNLKVCKNSAGETRVLLNFENFNPVDYADIESYEIYACDVTKEIGKWEKLDSVKPLLLPMGVTLKQFNHGQKFFFIVRAIDEYKRSGDFSDAKTWT
jgi:hypothetical protein